MDSAISLMNMLHKEKHLLKLTLAAVFSLVAGCASANAEEYNAGKFFQLDLKAAILSPVPLGPAATFQSIKLPPSAEIKPVGRTVAPKLAAKRRNPLNAQASIPRRRNTPCRGKGICIWDPVHQNLRELLSR